MRKVSGNRTAAFAIRLCISILAYPGVVQSHTQDLVAVEGLFHCCGILYCRSSSDFFAFNALTERKTYLRIDRLEMVWIVRGKKERWWGSWRSNLGIAGGATRGT
jgi:hypothetical protein